MRGPATKKRPIASTGFSKLSDLVKRRRINSNGEPAAGTSQKSTGTQSGTTKRQVQLENQKVSTEGSLDEAARLKKLLLSNIDASSFKKSKSKSNNEEESEFGSTFFDFEEEKEEEEQQKLTKSQELENSNNKEDSEEEENAEEGDFDKEDHDEIEDDQEGDSGSEEDVDETYTYRKPEKITLTGAKEIIDEENVWDSGGSDDDIAEEYESKYFLMIKF